MRGPLNVGECTSSRQYQAAQLAGARGDVVRLRFLDVAGHFEALYADGTTMTGQTSSN